MISVKPRRSHQRLFWLYFALWTALLVVPSLDRFLDLSIELPSGLSLDKLVHAVGYAAFGFLATYAISGCPPLFRLSSVLLVGLIHSAGTEVIQRWIPSREGDLADWVADVAGLVLGICLSIVCKKAPCNEAVER